MKKFNPQVNMAKLLLQKVLTLQKCEFIEFSYIFRTQKSQLKANYEVLNTSGHKMIADIFTKKAADMYKDGKFLNLKNIHR